MLLTPPANTAGLPFFISALQVVGAVGFQNKSLPPPTEGDPFLIGLCLRCLAPNPRSRPLFPQIVQASALDAA